MDVAGFALALLGFALAGGIWYRSSKQAQANALQRTELEGDLERTKARSAELEAEAKQAAARIEQLEKDLAEAIARKDEKAIASVMWELELERSYRQWRDVVVPSDSVRAADVNVGQQLTFAIAQNVDRLREEVGVSIRFDGALDLTMEPESALGMLRISEELLALAAKQADEVQVSVDQHDLPAISLTLDCQGWSDEDREEVDALSASVERIASKLDGSVAWERGSDDAVRVVVGLPAPAPEATVS